MVQQQRGFSLVELITVIVLLAIIGGVYAARTVSQTSFQLQAGRDQLISAFFMAQQAALHQSAPVRLSTGSTWVDIRQDRNTDGIFAADESLQRGGSRYPQSLPNGIQVSNHSFDFDRLGHTQAAVIVLSKGGASAQITVSATGYAR